MFLSIIGDPNIVVYGDFADPVLLNPGVAVSIQAERGLCTGGWVGVAPEELNPGVPGGL